MKYLKLALLLLLAMVVVGCNFGGTTTTPKLEVSVETNMIVGETYPIEVTLDGKATTYDCSFSELDILEYQGDSFLALNEGTLTIIITSKTNPDLEKEIEITVTAPVVEPEDVYYDLTYVTNGGTILEHTTPGGTVVDETVTYLENTTVTLATPTKESHKFIGWYTNENFTGAALKTVQMTENITVYAKWEEVIDLAPGTAAYVINLIKQLPTSITIEAKEAVEEARKAYDELSAEEQDKVTNFSKLTNAEYRMLIENGKVNTVINKINLISDELTSNDLELIEDAYEAYSALDEMYHPYITNLQKLLDAKVEIENVIFRETVQKVVDLIAALPLDLTLEDKTDVLVVKEQYEALTVEQQAEVTNYDVLENAIKTINDLQYVYDYESVIELIDALPANVTIDDLEVVELIEEKYNALTKEQKELVTNYSKFETAREQMDEILDNLGVDIDSYVPDLVTENVYLPTRVGNQKLSWSVSNSNLIEIDGEIGRLNQLYQTHQNQEITFTVVVTLNGQSQTYTKETTVGPVLFHELDGPVAAYVNSSALYHYVQYNGREEMFSDIAKETLDIAYYCFVNPAADGSVTIPSAFDKYYEEVIALREYGVRVVVSVNGNSKTFSNVCYDDALREKFAQGLVDVVQRYNFDGIDLDWEFPGVDTGRTDEVDSVNYTKLFASLRSKLDALQVEGGSNYLLTSAVPGTSWGTNHYDFPGLNTYLDYVNLMSYDLNNTSKTTHLSPLYSSSNDNGYGFSVDYGMKRFVDLGLDKEKIIIGCATYGKLYKLSTAQSTTVTYPALGKPASLTSQSNIVGSFASGTIYYYGVLQLKATGRFTEYTEKLPSGGMVGTYLYSPSDNLFITYESAEMFAAKYSYAKAHGLGIMCWSMPEDATDTYINTIYNMQNK